jgi:hypothetical protein
VGLRKDTIDAIAKAQYTQASLAGDEHYLVIEYINSGDVYHHCEFGRDDNTVPTVACRHFNFAFGEKKKVRKQPQLFNIYVERNTRECCKLLLFPI